jgi:hypothetical protein
MTTEFQQFVIPGLSRNPFSHSLTGDVILRHYVKVPVLSKYAIAVDSGAISPFQLTSQDVSKNTALYRLFCNNNRLTRFGRRADIHGL